MTDTRLLQARRLLFAFWVTIFFIASRLAPAGQSPASRQTQAACDRGASVARGERENRPRQRRRQAEERISVMERYAPRGGQAKNLAIKFGVLHDAKL